MRLGYLVAALGVALAAVSALADPLGIGVAGFGWKQITGTVVGVAAAIVGAWLAATARRRHAGVPSPGQRP